MSDDAIDLDDIARRMDGALAALKTEFAGLRTGRASAQLLEPIKVDAYGSEMPIEQVGTISVPEPRMVAVNVWDKSMVSAVEKAIRESGLGLNPIVDGQMLRMPIPELNEERRNELVKVARNYAEQARIAVRNVRRDGMDQLKKASGLPEDDKKIYESEVQDATDAAIANIDKALAGKEEEIMQV